MQSLSSRVITISACLAAFSTVAQLVHIGYQSPTWGMWIDVVAVSWIIAWFLYGGKGALLVSLTGALMITLFAPETWLGASMKWIATFPIWMVLFIWTLTVTKHTRSYSNMSRLVIPVTLAVIIRCLIVIPINYYYAIPIWTGMNPNQAMQAIPWYVIAGFNTVQTVVDVGIAWILVYRFKLSRYAQWV